MHYLQANIAFQSTLPARGATNDIASFVGRIGISIHAPRTGSDHFRHALQADQRHFNPRSPHGERPFFSSNLLEWHTFQSTLPARGATADRILSNMRQIISIHAPRTGSDQYYSSVFAPYYYFNPRSPHGERPERSPLIFSSRTISIHAPRTGSDRCPMIQVMVVDHFNPRSPHGERLIGWIV